MMKISTIITILLMLFSFSCEGGKMGEKTASLKNDIALKDAIAKVANQRIYFGHQSVGYNIIDGIKDLSSENPGAHINIVETKDAATLNGKPGFMHSAVGNNMDPTSKLEDFSRTLDSGIADKADIAFVKFCYVDITQDSDVQKIFDLYKETICRLKKKYPKITFVHFTAPLTSKQTDIKTMAKNLIKKIIGRPVRTYKDNLNRNRYNALLKKEYEGKDPIFDLAGIESTLPDGSKVSYSEDGVQFYALAPDYTDDGGHLNKLGRRAVAARLIEFLAALPDNNNRR